MWSSATQSAPFLVVFCGFLSQSETTFESEDWTCRDLAENVLCTATHYLIAVTQAVLVIPSHLSFSLLPLAFLSLAL